MALLGPEGPSDHGQPSIREGSAWLTSVLLGPWPWLCWASPLPKPDAHSTHVCSHLQVYDANTQLSKQTWGSCSKLSDGAPSHTSHPASRPNARLRDTKFPPAGLWGTGLTWSPLSPALVGKGRLGEGKPALFLLGGKQPSVYGRQQMNL